MVPYFTSIVVGKRGSGKSVFTTNILYKLRKTPLAVVISPTNEVNDEFSPYIPPNLIYTDYDGTIIENLKQRQIKVMKQRPSKDPHRKYNPQNDVLLILNDITFDAALMRRDKMLAWLFKNGRHYQITTVILCQYVKDLPPVLRTNTDYVFCCRDNNSENLKKLYDAYFGVMPSYPFFQDVFLAVTENYGIMCLNNRSLSMDLTDLIYWYHATLKLPKFKLCSEKLWKYARKKQRLMHEESKMAERNFRKHHPNQMNQQRQSQTKNVIQKARTRKTPRVNVMYS